MKLPKISVITPSYNQGRYLEQTIVSVLNQSYPDREYIVIDGGSADNSVDIIRKYHDRISYWVSEADKGQSDAINKGFERSSGEIVAWLNSDDQYFSRDVLAKVAEFFSTNPDIDACYADNVYINERNEVLYLRKGMPVFCKRLLQIWNFLHQPTVFMRRHVFEACLVNPTLHYAMDYDLWLRIAQRFRFGYLNSIIAVTRWHDSCKTSKNAKESFRETQYVQQLNNTLWCGNFLLMYLSRLLYAIQRMLSVFYCFQLNDSSCSVDLHISWPSVIARQVIGSLGSNSGGKSAPINVP